MNDVPYYILDINYISFNKIIFFNLKVEQNIDSLNNMKANKKDNLHYNCIININMYHGESYFTKILQSSINLTL